MKRYIFLIIFLALIMIPGVKGLEVTDFNELKTAINNGEANIEINNEIMVTEELVIKSGKNITLKGNGILKLANPINNKAIYKIENGAILTIDGVTLDGNGSNVSLRGTADLTVTSGSGESGSFIYCEGTLNLKSGNIQNITSKQIGGNMGIIYIAENAEFNMSGGEIKNNKYKPDASQRGGFYDRAIVALKNGSKMTLSGGSINNNAFDDSAINNYDDVDYCWGGIVYLHDGSSLDMSGGAIENNHYRALIVGTKASATPPKTTVNMTGGKISNNHFSDYKFFKGYYVDYPEGTIDNVYNAGYLFADSIGGGVLLYQGTFTLDGGSITGNDAMHGGGVAVFAVAGNSNQANFVMKKGTVSNNEAYVGGGIFVSGSEGSEGKENVHITGGTINNNNGKYQGGGAYSCKGFTIHFENVIIHDNDASVMGGGIWGCPTSNIYTYINNGGAIYNNKAAVNGERTGGSSGQAGDDIASVPQADGHITRLSERALGGGKADYYHDGKISGGTVYTSGAERYALGKIDSDSKRFNENNKGEKVTGVNTTSEGYALHSDFEDNTIKLAKDMHKVELTGNTSKRGAGIGTNGNIIIGTTSDINNPAADEYQLNVEKKWEGDFAEEEVKVQLIRVYNKKEYALDSITLTKDSPKGKFTGLPKGEYLVKELDVKKGVTVSYSKNSVNLSQDKKEDTIVVTNKKDESKVGGLIISKKTINIDQKEEFEFTITLNDKSINGKYGDLTFVNGVAKFSLKNKESVKVLNLPAGTKYEITMKSYSSKGYSSDRLLASGTIIADEILEEEFISEFKENKETPKTGLFSNAKYFIGLIVLGLSIYIVRKKLIVS